MFEPRGGHISPSVSGAGAVIKLPPGLDPVAYSGLVLTQVGFNCGDRPRLSPGDLSVVVGDGLVGQWAAQMLASRGANTLLIGRHADRLAKFKNGETLLEDSGAWVDAVRERFPEGAQVGVDTWDRSGYGTVGKFDETIRAPSFRWLLWTRGPAAFAATAI